MQKFCQSQKRAAGENFERRHYKRLNSWVKYISKSQNFDQKSFFVFLELWSEAVQRLFCDFCEKKKHLRTTLQCLKIWVNPFQNHAAGENLEQERLWRARKDWVKIFLTARRRRKFWAKVVDTKILSKSNLKKRTAGEKKWKCAQFVLSWRPFLEKNEKSALLILAGDLFLEKNSTNFMTFLWQMDKFYDFMTFFPFYDIFMTNDKILWQYNFFYIVPTLYRP